MRRLASICPLAGVADSLQGKFSPLLISARLYLSPRLHSRFSLSLIFYPAVGEVLALFLPQAQGILVIASLAVIQTVPIVLPATLAYGRRRAVEAELPFFLIALSIFSRASSPTIDDGLRKLAALGDGVFPELSKEQAILERDVTCVPGSPDQVVEPGRSWNGLFAYKDGSWEGSPEQSAKLERRAAGYGFSAKRVSADLERRPRFLESLVGKVVADYQTLSEEFRRFYCSEVTF